MKTKDRRYIIVFLVALVSFVVDQATKLMVVENIPLHGGFNVIPGFFNLVHVQNFGAAFGFLNDPSTDWQFWFFAVVTVFMCGFILNLVRQSAYSFSLFLGLGLILGGALGNFMDRVLYRYVIDFLDFFWKGWHWPVFNVADICICVGTFSVIILFALESKRNDTKQ